MLKDTQTTAQSLGVQLQVVEAKEVADFDAAFAAMVKERAEALIVLVNPMFNVQRRHIIERADNIAYLRFTSGRNLCVAVA